jgi:adenylyl-sulfate kinase
MMMYEKREIVWHSGQLSLTERLQLLGLEHQPLVLWFTGLSGAGKSTLAFALEQRLISMGLACMVLDGDNVRHGLNRDLGFSAHDRSENIRRVAEVSRLMIDAGLMVITSFISPFKDDRALAQSIIGREQFLEVYLNTPLAMCEERDTKGLYRKARSGDLPLFTGISSPYEPPENAVLTIDTAVLTLNACLESLLDMLIKRRVIKDERGPATSSRLMPLG